MLNFNKFLVRILIVLFATFITHSQSAKAQSQAQGFSAERFYPSAAGAGWFVMDNLDMHGELGGAAGLALGYAHNPMRIKSSDGSQSLSVVSTEAFVDVGLAVTYQRYRISLNLPSAASLKGDDGAIDNHLFTAPKVDFESQPDTLSDMRISVETRLYGEAEDPFRLGVGVQLISPSGERANYISDENHRVMARLLVAGDTKEYTYAGQLGVHFRSINDPQTTGSPQGNELLFGLAGGTKISVGAKTNLVIGPEVFGASPFRSLMTSSVTDFEALLTSRFEWTNEDGRQIRAKIGIGSAINSQFESPDWRILLGVELYGSTR